MTDLKHAALDWIETAKNAGDDATASANATIALGYATLLAVEAADAQVAATLAQTEQLRIGNLIAFRALAHKEVASYRKNPEHWHGGIEGTVARSAIAALLIRSGLGL